MTEGKIRTEKQQYKAWQMILAEKDMSVYRLAKEAGVSYSTVLNAIKRDIGCMQIDTALALSEVLGMSIDDMVAEIRYKEQGKL